MKQDEKKNAFDLKIKVEQLKDKIEPKSSFSHGLILMRNQVRHDAGYLARLYRRGFVPKEGCICQP
jgi:hypothetical protein